MSDLPRPDRLGLVMKYLCALKGSSPAAALMRWDEPSGRNFQLCSLSLKFGDHDLVEHLFVHGRIEDRAQRLDAAVEIARHHVGGGDVDRGFRMRQAVAAAEAVDAAVLEEAADDRLDADILGQARDAGPQAADAAHHEIDLTRRRAMRRRAGR